jgi:AraC-like DNA-binding protein
MIISRQTFEYQQKVIIEKVRFSTPFKHEAIFQNQGCFLYFKNTGAKLLSSEDNIEINNKEAVLLRCGAYFMDILKNANHETLDVIAVHLYPDILRKLYIKELPTIIKRKEYSKKSQIVASTDVIARFIESLEFYFENPILVNEDLLELKIKELVLLLVQSKNVESILELISDLYSTKTVDLKRVMDLHLFSNLSIEELAHLSNLSVSSFKRNFKKEFNDSPNNYILTKKLEKAQELLQVTDMTISDIAYEIGFNDPLYFTRFFKKKIGMSPTDFRSQQLH